MMYPFMTLDDNTEIVHTETVIIDEKESVKVYIEKPVEGGFHSAECYLPQYEWKNIEGFSKEEVKKYQDILESTAHIIIRLAREGGLGDAANF